MMDTDVDFLGQGWQFPVRLEGDAIARSLAESSIAQSVWLILGTERGERVMRPDFGCGLQGFVFALNDASTAGRIADEVRDALVLWEPRIDVLDVDVSSAADDPTTLLIDIHYQVRATNNVFNLVYPFYVE